MFKSSKVITVLIMIIALNGVSKIIPGKVKVSDILKNQPDELVIQDLDKYKIYKNSIKIKKFHKELQSKTAKRIGRVKTLPDVEYGYKGKGLAIMHDGSVIIFISKTEIRNKSRVHWLWWKINKLYDRGNYVSYMTEPDTDIKEIMNEIRLEIYGSKDTGVAG